MLKSSSLHFLLALATILGFNMYSLDVAQSYLQYSSDLRRKTFIKPDVYNLQADKLCQLVEPINGLTDSGDYWDEKFQHHQQHHLDKTPATGDHSFFFNVFPAVLSDSLGLMWMIEF